MIAYDDVAIVGAGPAGAWAAYTLAGRGARVTILDASHPREKSCGGGVTGRALALVAGAIAGSRLPATTIRSARFVNAGSERIRPTRSAARGTADGGRLPLDPAHDVSVPLDGQALVVASRASFDAALLTAARAAGARVVEARVTDVIAGRDVVALETTGGPHRAAFVIGADGANSLVRRRLAEPFSRRQLSIATGFFAHGVTSDEIAIEFVADPPGYIWSFPRPDHLAIGICAQADAGPTAEHLRLMCADWIRRTRIAGDARLQPYSWPIPSLNREDFDRLPLAGSRWCLIGDAAGMVDPITREGIFFAIATGRWAAETLVAGDSLGRYATRVHDEAVGELARASALRARFFTPAFTRLMLDAIEHSAAVRGVVADLIAGRQPYATLKWRLLRTLEIGSAIRLARNLFSF